MTTVLLRRRKNRLLLALQDLESRKNTQTKTETLRRECQKYLLFLVKISRVLSNIEKMCENVRKFTHFISLRSDAILALRRPNVGETTVICDLGTSTVRFSVHAKMLTMSIVRPRTAEQQRTFFFLQGSRAIYIPDCHTHRPPNRRVESPC